MSLLVYDFLSRSRVMCIGGWKPKGLTCNIACVRYLLAVAAVVVCSMVQPAHAAPVFGEVFTVKQPDGKAVQVRIWGDEFYQIVESLDGYTLTRDPGTSFICYARLSADGNALVSTGAVLGQTNPTTLTLNTHVRINREAQQAEVLAAREAFFSPQQSMLAPTVVSAYTPKPISIGNVKGIVLLVDFEDDVGTILPSDINDYCNQVGYTGYGNNGSVRDYFYDVSDGKLTYTNDVMISYYRAIHPKSYYDDPAYMVGPRAKELILEALNYLKANGFDFSPYDSNGDNFIDAINCLYAGYCNSPWAKGLWPHMSEVYGFSDDGVSSQTYQICSLHSGPYLGAFCHENGHVLMRWPDLYDYDHDSSGVGRFCLMCNGGSPTNPIEPCAYLKALAGWTNTIQLATSQTGLTATAGINTIYKFPHPFLANEYYLIENRNNSGRDAAMWDSGLAIWHVDEKGSNNDQQMTPEQHYECTLVQADGDWDLENARNPGDDTDLWKSPYYTTCGPTTDPSTFWWDGAEANLEILDISAAGATMTFSVVIVDCNGNGYTDDYDIDAGISKDCNDNQVPDECESDEDRDGAIDVCDNCPSQLNVDQLDTDGDGAGDACDSDMDNDGIDNEYDNCKRNVNPDQIDSDNDAVGDVCDNCVNVQNYHQENLDKDLLGDACDDDDDGDGALDTMDNCPRAPNPDQMDIDNDGLGDACDSDMDGDGDANSWDNCPTIPNPNQEDADGDREGDVCDLCTDIDGDGFGDPSFAANECVEDNCPDHYNADQLDVDNDAVGDVCDNCPTDTNADQADADSDTVGDVCDNCINAENLDQLDLDGDAIGDACDDDIDGDGLLNLQDNCPTTPNSDQGDNDTDGVGDVCDACPETPSGAPVDQDGCALKIPGDFDADSDVDLDDFAHLQVCFSGNAPQLDPDCLDTRLDDNERVDEVDISLFIDCVSGSNVPGDPFCLD